MAEIVGFLKSHSWNDVVQIFALAMAGSLLGVGLVYYFLFLRRNFPVDSPVRTAPLHRLVRLATALLLTYLAWRLGGRWLPWPALRPAL